MTARLLAPLAACAVLAACGGGGGSSSQTPATLSARSIDGVGKILVDAHGAALYTPDQEADGKVRCSGPCTAIWEPLAPGAAAPTADVSGKLGVIKRADGRKQVSYDGKPLYTFSQDSAGKVTGNGAKDSFDGTAFTWRAVTTTGTAKQSSGDSRGSGY